MDLSLKCTMPSSENTNTTVINGQSRIRSSTIRSVDSAISASYTTSNNAATPIRPRPILASSSYSFDSGVEVSPLMQRSFGFGDEQQAEQMAALRDDAAQSYDHDDDHDNRDNIEGFDDELISIDYHFTPISLPNRATFSASNSSAFSYINLAQERRNNRASLPSNNHVDEMNNDIFFPNLNRIDQSANGNTNMINGNNIDNNDDMMFDMFNDDDEDVDDDVFFDDDQEDPGNANAPDVYEPRWNIPRPSCLVSASGPNDNDSEDDEQHIDADHLGRVFLPSQSSNASSRRSSTPIPIPGSRRGSDAGFDSMNGISSAFTELSLPTPLTRMPYYHPMAAPLNSGNLLNERANQRSQPGGGGGNLANRNHAEPTRRSTTFGTRFEASQNLITRNMMPSPFSPVPFLNRWQPQYSGNDSAAVRPGSIWLRFGQLPASPTYPIRTIPNHFRSLTPHYEMDETESSSSSNLMQDVDEVTASSSHGLVFNFSQLSINEISGRMMDLEVQESLLPPPLPQPHSSEAVTIESKTVQNDNQPQHESTLPASEHIPIRTHGVSSQFISHFDLVQQSSPQPAPNMENHEQPRRPVSPNFLRRDPLPDIVGCHDHHHRQPERQNGHNDYHCKHHHRNTLPSFDEALLSNDQALPHHRHNHSHHHIGGGGLQERRTMSVSLPIEETVISHVALQLREISHDFSNRQIQRFNPLSQLSPMLNLLASTLYGGGVGAGAPRSRSTIVRRQTFAACSSSSSDNNTNSTRFVNNSRFYTATTTTSSNSSSSSSSVLRAEPLEPTAPLPIPTSTGNSTFYVGNAISTAAPSTVTNTTTYTTKWNLRNK